MSQLFNIQDDKVVINKLALRYLEGSVIHAGSLDIIGNTSIQSNLTVKGSIDVNGTINVETLNVKNLITDTGDSNDIGHWIVSRESDLVGKGLSWAWGDGRVQLAYREGNRLWSNGDFDLSAGKSFKIDNVEVISYDELGPQVVKSRLKEVGTLKSLDVLGNTLLSEFAFFNSGLARLGLNTDQPNGTLSVVENDVEFIIGSPNYGTANIGTYTNHNVSIITDNTPRVTFKNSGEVVFGSELTKSADVTIYGTLKVENLVTDTRVSRYSPLEFVATREKSVYGQGLIWSGTDSQKQFVMRSGPDRLWSTESIDLAINSAFFINGQQVLSESSLGPYVTNSVLTSVGTLTSLTVDGFAEVLGTLSTKNLTVETLFVSDNISITDSSVNATSSLSFKVADDETYYADSDEISIGNKLNTRRPVKVYGPLTVGVTNPDPTVKFSVNGNVSFNNKKFVTGIFQPAEGEFNKGDICWNENPTPSSYIGWVCINSGSPGTWAPFGAINSQ